jgi:Flp pilus assembly protein TadD
MLAMFGAALQNGPDAGMLSVYGKYALWVMHDPELALRLWRESAARGQRNPQLHVNLAMLAIHMGSFDEAQAEIDRVRASSMFDEYADDVLALEAALRRARASGEAVRTRPR